MIGATILDDGCFYQIPSKYNAYLNDKFSLDVAVEKTLAVRHKMDFDDLPYELHTGRELPLMLEGRKPLSVFFGRSYLRKNIISGRSV